MFDFLTIGKTLKSFAGELSSIRFEIESLTRNVEDIHYAPAHPDDVCAALEIWAADNAVKYREYLKSELGKLVHKPGILATKNEVWSSLQARGILPDPSYNLPISRDIQMCGLLGPSVFVETLKKQMALIDWPAPGLPMAERTAAIAVIDKKIAKLRTREADLIKSAELAGLSIS
jgi:hypothetical protein